MFLLCRYHHPFRLFWLSGHVCYKRHYFICCSATILRLSCTSIKFGPPLRSTNTYRNTHFLQSFSIFSISSFIWNLVVLLVFYALYCDLAFFLSISLIEGQYFLIHFSVPHQRVLVSSFCKFVTGTGCSRSPLFQQVILITRYYKYNTLVTSVCSQEL